MTNVEIVQKLNVAFADGCIEPMRPYIADDAAWHVAGAAASIAKDVFDNANHDKYFTGLPCISVKKEIEKENYVAVEGEIKCQQADGAMLDAFFFDVYRFENGKIKTMHSFIIRKKYPVLMPEII